MQIIFRDAGKQVIEIWFDNDHRTDNELPFYQENSDRNRFLLDKARGLLHVSSRKLNEEKRVL